MFETGLEISYVGGFEKFLWTIPSLPFTPSGKEVMVMLKTVKLEMWLLKVSQASSHM